MKPRLLDLFCGAGGAARGYMDAGFHVTGIDIAPQPDYPGDAFVQADIAAWADIHTTFVRDVWVTDFDAVHASPPCQHYTTMNNRWGSGSPPLIELTRRLLVDSRLPYVLENVMGARRHLRSPVKVCGRSLGLPIHRHRLFETNWAVMVAPCSGGRDPFGVYGKLDGRRLWTRPDGSVYRAARTLDEARGAMGMPWADWDGIREAIPPRYTEHVGGQLLRHLETLVAA